MQTGNTKSDTCQTIAIAELPFFSCLIFIKNIRFFLIAVSLYAKSTTMIDDYGGSAFALFLVLKKYSYCMKYIRLLPTFNRKIRKQENNGKMAMPVLHDTQPRERR